MCESRLASFGQKGVNEAALMLYSLTGIAASTKTGVSMAIFGPTMTMMLKLIIMFETDLSVHHGITFAKANEIC